MSCTAGVALGDTAFSFKMACNDFTYTHECNSYYSPSSHTVLYEVLWSVNETGAVKPLCDVSVLQLNLMSEFIRYTSSTLCTK